MWTMSDSTKLTVNYFCVGALLIFVGSVLLCALGFTIVLPFEATRSWPQVLCSVVNSSYDSSVCSCDEQLSVFDTCVSKYPCLQIYVSYSVLDTANETDHGGHGSSSDLPQSTAHVANPTGVASGRNLYRRRDDNGETPPADSRFRREAHWQHTNDLIVTTDDSLPLTTTTTTTLSVVLGNNDSRSPTDNPPIETAATSVDDLLTKAGYTVSEESLKSAAVSLLSSSISPQLVQHRASFSVGNGDDGNSTGEVTSSISDRKSTTTVAAPDITKHRRHDNDELHAPSTVQLRPDTETSPPPDRLRSYRAEDRSGMTTASATDDVRLAKLYRSWDDSFHRECSLTECGDDIWNVKEARRFRSEWGRVGQTFVCFYNPSRPEATIIERTSPVSAVHAIVWPCLFLITGVALWLGLCFGCWSVKSEQSYKDDYSGIGLR